MRSYIDTIEQAVYLFPIAVALISVPYFYYQYKKYGQVELKKSLLSFSFLLYIIVCYCLIILPLPTYEEVLEMTGPYTDMRVFGFVSDFFNKTEITLNPVTWASALKSVWFYQPFFNFLMLIPFGMYQKRLFKNSLFKTFIYAFFLSLSFELIQLSALLGIFPHPYRLFQIDDIILNTLGAVIGWLVIPKVKAKKNFENSKYLPNKRARTVTFILDLILLSLLIKLASILFGRPAVLNDGINDYEFYFIISFIYFIVISWFLNQRTPGSLLLDHSYKTRKGNKVKFIPFLIRQVIYFGIILPIPIFIISVLTSSFSRIITIPISILALLAVIIVIIQINTIGSSFFEEMTNVYLTDNRKLKRVNRDQRVSLSRSYQDRQ